MLDLIQTKRQHSGKQLVRSSFRLVAQNVPDFILFGVFAEAIKAIRDNTDINMTGVAFLGTDGNIRTKLFFQHFADFRTNFRIIKRKVFALLFLRLVHQLILGDSQFTTA